MISVFDKNLLPFTDGLRKLTKLLLEFRYIHFDHVQIRPSEYIKGQVDGDMKKRVVPVSPDALGQPIEVFVHQKLGIALESVERAMRHGALYLDGKRITGSRLLPAQGTVVLILEEKGRSAEESSSPAPSFRVLFEDESLIAVDKPAGWPTQPTIGRTGESLVDFVSLRCHSTVSVVHRLDLETSGVVVFGKTSSATAALALQFKNRAAEKKYLAITQLPMPLSGIISRPLCRDPKRAGNFKIAVGGQGIEASTRYQRLNLRDDFCAVALYPQTGRTHQLRVHLASIGAPIAGDTRYGGCVRIQERTIARCLLHAQSLRLAHPLSGKAIDFEAPVPADMKPFWPGVA